MAEDRPPAGAMLPLQTVAEAGADPEAEADPVQAVADREAPVLQAASEFEPVAGAGPVDQSGAAPPPTLAFETLVERQPVPVQAAAVGREAEFGTVAALELGAESATAFGSLAAFEVASAPVAAPLVGLAKGQVEAATAALEFLPTTPSKLVLSSPQRAASSSVEAVPKEESGLAYSLPKVGWLCHPSRVE